MDDVKRFKEAPVAHDNLTTAVNTLVQHIQVPVAPLILVYGPSHVGKTTLRNIVTKKIMALSQEQVEGDPSYIPIVSMSVMASPNGVFDLTDLYVPLLTKLGDPVCLRRRAIYPTTLFGDVEDVYPEGEQRKPRELRRVAINLLKRRRPMAVIIDEAQHMSKVGSGKRIHSQLDYIKSLVDEAGVPFILIGTYELLAFRDLGDQLNNRSVDVHFPRYEPEGSDLLKFRDSLYTMSQHMNVAKDFDIWANWEYMYERSLGCIGSLKMWLTAAYSLALGTQDKVLRKKHLDATAKSTEQLVTMAKEIVEGERSVAGCATNVTKLRQLIGLDKQSTRKDDADVEPGTKKSNPKGNVGDRNAYRDAVGAAVGA